VHVRPIQGRLIASTALILLLCALLPAAASAQADLTLAELAIRIWPEYDRPSALVILNGQVKDAAGPLTLRFALPESAAINAVAYLDEASGSLLVAQYTFENGVLELQSPDGSFHVELYDLALAIDGDARSYSFTYQGEYAVDALTWEVQQPPDTLEMTTSPPAARSGVDQFGLATLIVDSGIVQAGQPVTLSLGYTRSSTALTTDLLQPSTGGAAAPAPAPAAGGLSPVLLGGLGLIGLAIVSAGVFLFIKQRGTRPGAGARRTQPVSPSRPTRARSTPQSGEQRFCTQCGQPVSAEDRFCRHCGAALR